MKIMIVATLLFINVSWHAHAQWSRFGTRHYYTISGVTPGGEKYNYRQWGLGSMLQPQNGGRTLLIIGGLAAAGIALNAIIQHSKQKKEYYRRQEQEYGWRQTREAARFRDELEYEDMVIVDLRSYLAQNQPAGRDYASRRHADIDIDVNVETTITYPSGNLGTEPAAQQHGHCHGHLAPARQATPKMKKIPGGMFKKDKWVPIER